MTNALLSVEDLTVRYAVRGGTVHAVDGVSFSLERGETLALVGESGSGKSSVGMALLQLMPQNLERFEGRILFDGVDLMSLHERDMRPIRGARIAMVFQAAMNSLDPVYRVGDQVMEALEFHTSLSRAEAKERVRELYELVELDPKYIGRYPHEYSGGMKQRAVIAMALSCNPDLIIADEATTALDLIVQDRILRRLKDIQRSLGMSVMYISHDMAVVAEVADHVAVMYAGKIVEKGTVSEVYGRPLHPYTRAMLDAVPNVLGAKIELAALKGSPPDLVNPPDGCRFSARCPFAGSECWEEAPPVVVRGDHWAACWNPLEERETVEDDTRSRRTTH